MGRNNQLQLSWSKNLLRLNENHTHERVYITYNV